MTIIGEQQTVLQTHKSLLDPLVNTSWKIFTHLNNLSNNQSHFEFTWLIFPPSCQTLGQQVLQVTHLGLSFACWPDSLQAQAVEDYKLTQRTSVEAPLRLDSKRNATAGLRRTSGVKSCLQWRAARPSEPQPPTTDQTEREIRSLTFSFNTELNVWLRLYEYRTHTLQFVTSSRIFITVPRSMKTLAVKPKKEKSIMNKILVTVCGIYKYIFLWQ